MDLQELSDNLSSLDPENIGSWPLLIRVVIWVLTCFVCGFGVYHIFLKETLTTLEVKQQEEITEKDIYKSKASEAANLEALKIQMQEMKQTFGALLRQLPEDTEVPGLLEDMTQLGVDSGLEFESIDLGKENDIEFYSEQPIEIKVKGGYHALGNFVSGVAALPRIVTLHNYTIMPLGDTPNLLSMGITAKTYRYNNREEEE